MRSRRKHSSPTRLFVACLIFFLLAWPVPCSADESPFRLQWEGNILTITGATIPGGRIEVWYLEAYCRPGSTNRQWQQTVLGHSTRQTARSVDGRRIELRCTLSDGVIVDHVIRAVADGVRFELVARNPTDRPSDAHWAQPCIRVERFTGKDQQSYLQKCFVFLDGHLARMPTDQWALQALYTPGQVWCPAHVNRNDVNPRPLSERVPSNGLIGCFSGDESMILATAWEPYQELFQGVIVCLHSDFRIGGLKPGEQKKIRGRIYLVPADVDHLLRRYRLEFPEHQ